jgi:hypothetical protein
MNEGMNPARQGEGHAFSSLKSSRTWGGATLKLLHNLRL